MRNPLAIFKDFCIFLGNIIGILFLFLVIIICLFFAIFNKIETGAKILDYFIYLISFLNVPRRLIKNEIYITNYNDFGVETFIIKYLGRRNGKFNVHCYGEWDCKKKELKPHFLIFYDPWGHNVKEELKTLDRKRIINMRTLTKKEKSIFMAELL